MKKSSPISRYGSFPAFYFLPAFIAVVLYLNTIPNNYSIDDNIITLNPTVEKGIKAIPEIFTSRYQKSGQYYYGYRPVVKAMFAVEYSLFGRNPHISHFINVLLYALTVLVLFYVLKKIFSGLNVFFVFVIVILFAAHPLHTEAVASLKNREELICFLCCILSLHFFFRYDMDRKKWNILLGILLLGIAFLAKQNTVSFVLVIPLTLFFFGRTFFSKRVQKSSMTPPPYFFISQPDRTGAGKFLLALPDFLSITGLLLLPAGFLFSDERFFLYSAFILFFSCFTNRLSLSEARKMVKNGWFISGTTVLPLAVITNKYVFLFSIPFFLFFKYNEEKKIKTMIDFMAVKAATFLIPLIRTLSVSLATVKKHRNIIYLFIVLAVIAVGVLFVPDLLLPQQKRELNVFENPLFGGNDWLSRIALGFYSLVIYLKLLVFPHPLLFYYGYKHIPDVAVSSPWVILSIVIYLALFFIAVYYFRKHKILSFGILYYLCTIVFFSNIPAPVPGIVAERLLFMPSLGFCIVIAWVIFRLFKADPASAKISPPVKRKILTLLILILIPYSIKTIARNRDWKDEMTLFSHDIRHLKNSINANFLYASQLIFHINPNPATPVEKQESEKNIILAMKHFSQVLELDSANVKALANIGTLYFQFYANYPLAVAYLQKAVLYDSLFANGYFNLGLCYEKMGKNEEAVSNYLKSIRCDSSAIQSFSALTNHYFSVNDEANAFRINQRFMKAHPESDAPYLNAGQYYYARGNEPEAVSWFEKAVEKNPANKNLCTWLGEYFRRNGNVEKAQHYNRRISR